MRRHQNADSITGTKLTYPEHVSQCGICSMCAMDLLCEIGKRAKTGDTLFPQPFGFQFGAEKTLPNLEDIQIIPELYGKEVQFPTVKTEMTLGGFKVKIPVSVAAMGSTKAAATKAVALSRGAALAGIPLVIGENMIQTHGKEGVAERVNAYLENYKAHGAIIVQGNGVDIKNKIFEVGKELGAHGLEIKLGQGAKQGLGGEIKFTGDADAEKYRKLGYHVVKNFDGSYQRHTPPGSLVNEDLRDLMIKYAEYGIPIWAKISVGKGILKLIEFIDKVKKEQGIPFECLTIDGFGGGTGMSPWLIMNETTIPSGSVFAGLEKKPNFDIILAGGYNNGMDIGKGIMMGAKGVAMGRPFLIAAGALKDRDGVEADKGVANFVNAIRTEVQMVCATQRVNDISKLIGRRENLYPLSEEAAVVFGLSRKIKDVL